MCPPIARFASKGIRERSKLNTAWFIRTGFSGSEKSWLTHFMKCHTLSRPICTPLGLPVLPEVNMM
jgi:hypothetical protein